jgi:hypothetical protein
MVKIYTDTNVLRYFGEAFTTRSVPAELGVQLLLAPLSMLELLSQLGTDGAESAFAAVHALPRVHNPAATGMLPWSDDFFRICLFNSAPGKDTMTPSINNAVKQVLNVKGAVELLAEGTEMRAMLDRQKTESATNFINLLEGIKKEGRLEKTEDRKIFAESIARRAGMEPATVDVDFIVTALDAHYRFEQQRIEAAIANPKYNITRRANDVYDAELLIYLAEPSLHLLTCDRGFSRVQDSPQANRVHVVSAEALRNADAAIATLKQIVSSTATNKSKDTDGT